MNYLKYTQYVYLLASLFFFYDGFSKLYYEQESPWFSLVLGVVALFMFFFRRKFAKKFDDHDRNKTPQ